MDRAVENKLTHVDVLIAGAGVSGIGSAYYLQRQCPGKTFLILEAQESFGGTWLTHKYPGIRSDSDLYTYGFSFKPWTGAVVATAGEIRTYLREIMADNDLEKHIRYRHRISTAEWSSTAQRWTVTATRGDTGEMVRMTANFLWMCQGYYKHEQGYTPQWPDMDSFKGQIVHSQNWPADLEYKDKKVIVIGSGASAATIIPAIADQCAHVTMLQRSPTYYATDFSAQALADELNALNIEPAWFHEIMRRKVLINEGIFIDRCMNDSEAVKREMIDNVRAHVGDAADVETHFTPSYRPWQQRVAFVPGGDLFKSIRSGKASVTTGEIARFTPKGIELKSGEVLAADIIVAATGFDLCVLGDIRFIVDGREVKPADTVTYRGMMFTDLPNLVWVFGYFRFSWTPRVELVAQFFCRLLNHMEAKGLHSVVPHLRPEDQDMELRPWLTPDNFNPSYVMRGVHMLPRCGSKREWQHTQDYHFDHKAYPAIDLDDGALVFG